MWRVILGFLCCAAALPLFFLWKQGSLNFFLSGVMAAACLVGGVPLFYYFSRNKAPSFREITSVAGALGLLCALPFALMIGPFAVFFAIPFVPIGMAHGVLFWLIAVYRNGNLPIRWRPGAAHAD
jgi:hypothetical protein